jgi:hypothetical protein
VAAAAADEFLAALRAMHVGSADDLDAARPHVVEREQPVLARVDLERDVIEAGRGPHARIDERDAGRLHVRRELEQHHVMMLVVDPHEADRPAEVRRPPAAGDLQAQHLAIEIDRAIDVADVNADVAYPAEANAHAVSPSFRRRDRVARLGRGWNRRLVAIGRRAAATQLTRSRTSFSL